MVIDMLSFHDEKLPAPEAMAAHYTAYARVEGAYVVCAKCALVHYERINKWHHLRSRETTFEKDVLDHDRANPQIALQREAYITIVRASKGARTTFTKFTFCSRHSLRIMIEYNWLSSLPVVFVGGQIHDILFL